MRKSTRSYIRSAIKLKWSVIALLSVGSLFFFACTPDGPVIEDWDEYIADYKSWQEQRLDRLKTETGWMNLAGLFWLREGENSIGSDTSNSIIFPEKFEEHAGVITLRDSLVHFNPVTGIEVLSDGEAFQPGLLYHDQQENTTQISMGSFRWYIIKRGERYGIRLRDLEHPRLEELDHIPSYPFKKEWVVVADYMKYDTLRTLKVPTVIEDFFEEYEVPGEMVFKWKGKKQTLLPFKSRSGFFLIVGDASNGVDTYGAGRFMYAGPLVNGKVILDFNRAYNPPCAFSPFATCPIPPLENILDISIDAGEKAVHLE